MHDTNGFLDVSRMTVQETGQPRRAGFELEFAGLDLPSVADILTDVLGGNANKETQAEYTVDVPELGKFKIELDWHLGKVIARQRQAELDANAEDPLMEALTTVASEIVPVEIVCPPIPFKNMEELLPLIDALRDAGAQGTRMSPIFAFGVHINPELPDTSAMTISSFLKAFCLSQDWLVQANDVDLSRRLTPYIDLFPQEYIGQVLQYSENVTLETIMDDYLLHNPTRNRALDMTPLFRHLDEARLVSKLDDDRINARPTFHYRLPDCRLTQSGWNLSHSWNLWCVVEHLSMATDDLANMTAEWQARDQNIVSLTEPSWHKRLTEIYDDLLSA